MSTIGVVKTLTLWVLLVLAGFVAISSVVAIVSPVVWKAMFGQEARARLVALMAYVVASGVLVWAYRRFMKLPSPSAEAEPG